MSKAVRLSDAIEEFLNSRRALGYSENTLRGDKVVLLMLMTDVGNIYVRSIEPSHVDRYFASRSTLEQSTLGQHQTRIGTFFQWCMKRNYMTKDPLVGRRRAALPVKSKVHVPLERFDELLDAAAHPRDRILIALGLYLFLRASELTSLKVGDVDLDRGEVSVRIHKTKDLDVMPICQELDTELRRWLTWYAEHLDGPLLPDMYLVPAKQPYRRLTGMANAGQFGPAGPEACNVKPYQSVTRVQDPIKAALAKIGLPTTRQGGHTLRRSGARALFESLRSEGTDHSLQRVRVMLHHKSVAMTELYLGITPERELRNQKIKGQLMFPRKPAADNVLELRR